MSVGNEPNNNFAAGTAAEVAVGQVRPLTPLERSQMERSRQSHTSVVVIKKDTNEATPVFAAGIKTTMPKQKTQVSNNYIIPRFAADQQNNAFAAYANLCHGISREGEKIPNNLVANKIAFIHIQGNDPTPLKCKPPGVQAIPPNVMLSFQAGMMPTPPALLSFVIKGAIGDKPPNHATDYKGGHAVLSNDISTGTALNYDVGGVPIGLLAAQEAALLTQAEESYNAHTAQAPKHALDPAAKLTITRDRLAGRALRKEHSAQLLDAKDFGNHPHRAKGGVKLSAHRKSENRDMAMNNARTRVASDAVTGAQRPAAPSQKSPAVPTLTG